MTTASPAAAALLPRIIRCEEQGEVDIDVATIVGADGRLNISSEVQGGEYFDVALRRGLLRLRARGFVGYVPLNDHAAVYVRPRVPVANLGRLAQIAGQPARSLSIIRAYQTDAVWNPSLIDLYAVALADHVDELRDLGLFRQYRRAEEVTSSPRGRVLVASTVRQQWSRGIRHRATATHFERTADTPVNQCIKYAMWMLAQHYLRAGAQPESSSQPLRRLNSSYAILSAVGLDAERRFMDDPLVTGAKPLPSLRSYYRDPLDLALLIIRQHAITLTEDGGSIRMRSVVLNMNELFERYVRRSLQLSAETNNWHASVIDGNVEGRQPLFRDRLTPLATPDVIVRGSDGSTRVILEVKNIPVSNSGLSSRDAVDQVAAYALSFKANQVVLVHPKLGCQEGGLHRLGQLGHVTVWQYRINLAAVDLSVEDRAFAAAVAGLTDGIE